MTAARPVPVPPARPRGRLGALAAAVTLGPGLLLSAFPALAIDAGTSCPPSHGLAHLATADGSSVFDGDPARNFQLSPNRQETRAGGAWRNRFSFAPGASVTVVCRYSDGFRHDFILAPAVRACVQEAGKFECR